MGQFTAEEFANVANAAIDFHLKGKPESQILQDRPLYNDLMANAKSFPGGKEYIDGPVKGAYSSSYTGYSHDDDVAYVNPTNIKRWKYKWYEMASGIKFTNTELKTNGIIVTDSMTGERTSSASQADVIRLCNIIDDKMDDLLEGSRRSLAEILWRDGTQDSKVPPGVLAMLTTTPSSGLTGGLNRADLTWWRHRTSLGIDASTPANLNIINTLQPEIRQLRRYGNPRHKAYAGSDFLDALEQEIRSKGNFTLDGWWKSGKIDAGMADLAFKGVEFVYDPLLDDLSLAKHCFFIDLKGVRWMPMDGEQEKSHTPARPPEKFVYYRALTTTGALVFTRLNTSGRYSIA